MGVKLDDLRGDCVGYSTTRMSSLISAWAGQVSTQNFQVHHNNNFRTNLENCTVSVKACTSFLKLALGNDLLDDESDDLLES